MLTWRRPPGPLLLLPPPPPPPLLEAFGEGFFFWWREEEDEVPWSWAERCLKTAAIALVSTVTFHFFLRPSISYF